ncbi:MAG: leucyl aminopeptidase [Elusimicrobiota bacterium]
MLSIDAGLFTGLNATQDPLVLFAFSDGGIVDARLLPNKLLKALKTRCEEEDFHAKLGETVSLRASDGTVVRPYLIVGLGKRKAFNSETLRRCGGHIYRAAKSRFETLWVSPPAGLAAPLAEGLLLGSYVFLRYKRPDAEPKLKTVRLLARRAPERARFKSAAARATLFCEAVFAARDLVNRGPSDKSPEALARLAEGLAGPRLSVKVIDKKAAEKLGMGSFLSVARGSSAPPYFVHLVYKPKGKARKRVGLAGKGITFDSGGLSLKRPPHMAMMKMDMAGAAAVLAIFKVLPRLGVRAEVHGFTPLAYNMPGCDAIKPGDVVRAMNGKTIEILNTDAEGRLVLADALAYAARQKLDVLMDLATLTGSILIALGDRVTGAMTNDKALLKRVLAVADKTSEPIWEMPLVKDYRKHITSRIADIKNIGKGREGGAIIGGIFLQEFVDGTPWIHFDIAGTAWSDGHSYCPPGGTGTMVRTMLEYLTSL